jgi:hypothetical protein
MRYVKAQSAVVWIRQNDCRTRTCQEAGVLVEGPWRVNCFFWLTTRADCTPPLLPCYFAVLVPDVESNQKMTPTVEKPIPRLLQLWQETL